jgi:16S rRNA A1518/A1519 N6-dimethyltransferase RsmA/KsgA/DIM1 with predicted DNA glycosylase/AP lyase activity
VIRLGVPAGDAERVLEEVGIARSARAEELGLEDFARLAKAVASGVRKK